MTTRALMLLGPTASGKTAAVLALAQRFDIEIISVDSALIYRGMDIGTAKPSKMELAVCPHHLIDICDIDESFSAADFRREALRLIDEITERGRFPVIAGGTMLYAKALREGIDDLPDTDPVVRERITQQGQELGWPRMHERLADVDPLTAARLAPNDSQRISRALEVYAMTGRALSSFHAGVKQPDASIVTVGLMPADRARLHAAIAERFDIMLEQGLLDEVRGLMRHPGFDPNLSSMRCVGYRQSIEYLSGAVDYPRFVESAKAATRQLAKRQMTWLRGMREVLLLDPYALGAPALLDRLQGLMP